MASPENRAILIDLAVRWMRLAERAVATRPVQQQQQVQPKQDKQAKQASKNDNRNDNEKDNDTNS
jgi:hypothetical protein